MTKIPASCSSVKFELPIGWDHCTQEQLHYLYARLTEGYPTAMVKTFFVFRMAGFSMIGKTADGIYHVSCPEGHCYITPQSLAGAVEKVAWIDEPPSVPVALTDICGYRSIDTLFHGLPFGKYLTLDNYYQGYLQEHQDESIIAMATILYPGIEKELESGEIELDEVEHYAIFMWMVSIKQYFAKKWPDLFAPAAGGGGVADQEAIMNAQIRALTGGDVLKEKEIWDNVDTWRALTELNEKAKEYKQLNKKK